MLEEMKAYTEGARDIALYMVEAAIREAAIQFDNDAMAEFENGIREVLDDIYQERKKKH